MIAALGAVLGAAAASCCGPVDTPNERSSHVRPRPRAGGLGLLLGAGAALLALALGAAPGVRAALGPDAGRLALIIGAAAATGVLGLLDDMSVIGLRTKFLGIAAMSLLVAWVAGPVRVVDAGAAAALLPYWLALGGSALWVFVAINATNFMDGSDGMIAASMAVAGLALAVLGAASGAPVAAVCGVVLAGSLTGFAPFNAPHARVFAGDTGALFAGALFAAGALDLADHGLAGAVWCAPLLLAPFLADVFATLIVRARRGASLMEGHREHVYQMLIARGVPHWGAAALYALAGLVCAVVAAMALSAGPGVALAVMGLVAGIGLAGAVAVRPLLAPRPVRTPG